MKANELMIGDICKFSKGKYPYKRGEVYVIKSPECIYLHDKLEGIPLTVEILEENGFRYKPLMKRWLLDSELELIEDRMGDTDLEYWFSVNDQYVCPIHHVHSLQHVLRLCGLTDLADNFKV